MRFRSLVLAFPLVLGACGYNSIQSMDENAAAAQKQIAVQLQRRADLVPNLVETVKGYAAHEAEVFEKVAQARAGLAGAVSGGKIGEMADANQQMTGALGRLLAISENYPTLKSDQNFLRLQDELTGTENRIAVSRTDYNGAVQAYNEYIRKFPQVMTAKVIGSKAREYFDVTNPGAREAPKVDFSKPAAKP
ncbi:MAG: LemA family protein [Gemmatimonadetes bacterium]|nr:LemA family protein [Gemmatimonadota bacterium]